MTKLCSLLPYHIMDKVVNDFQFVEAGWCVYRPYLDYCLTQPATTPIVLDNSTHLYGFPMPDEYMISLMRRFVARYSDVTLVVPDCKNDTARTLSRAQSFFSNHLDDVPNTVRLMIVPQGKTEEEYWSCYRALMGYLDERPGLNITFGIPYQSVFPSKWWWENRQAIAYKVPEKCHSRIHLLGLSNPKELSYYHNFDVEVYNDSSAAYIHAMQASPLLPDGWGPTCTEKLGRKLDITEVPCWDVWGKDILWNVNMIRIAAGRAM